MLFLEAGRRVGPEVGVWLGLRVPLGVSDSTADVGLSRRERLGGARQFAAVFAGRMRKGEGPMTVFVVANGKGYPRLGLSVGRVVGNSVVRNRLKRLVREAFRLSKGELMRVEGAALDVVVSFRAHRELGLEEYRARLVRLVGEAGRDLERRARRKPTA